MSRCLVTGGRGFIGGAVVRLLELRDHSVTIFDRLDGYDVMNRNQLLRAVDEADVVFDCSGRLGSAETFADIRGTLEANVFGTLNLLEACKFVGIPLIFVSLKNEWYNPYMISKQAANGLCMMFAQYLDTKVSVIQGLNAYGPGQHWGSVHKMIPTFITRAIKGEDLLIYGDGKQIVDLIYVDDLAEITIRAWEWGAYCRFIEAGTGVPSRVIDIADRVIDLVGSASRIRNVHMRPGEPHGAIALADPTQALRWLDFYPCVQLEAGLRLTVGWYEEHWQEMER